MPVLSGLLVDINRMRDFSLSPCAGHIPTPNKVEPPAWVTFPLLMQRRSVAGASAARTVRQHSIPDADVNKAAYFALTGKVNNASWKGFAAGEVLFLGVSGSKRGEDDWEITFRFAASPNRTNIQIGNITVASKKGWEYLWVRYADVEDGGSNTLVKQPVAVYVEKVYEEGDFSALGIGT